MPLPDQTPQLPKLPFLVGDAALLAAAWFIANRAPDPWSTQTIFTIAGCVFGAAIIGAVPFVTDYARRQDVALDDRQRGLEALARTVATSAEQISIAAQGLHEIAELAAKNLKQAEQLRLAAMARERDAAVPPEAGVGPGGRARLLASSTSDASSNERPGEAARPYLEQEKTTEISPRPIEKDMAATDLGGTDVAALPADPASEPAALPVAAKPPRKPRAPRKPKAEVPASPAAEALAAPASAERPENREAPETFTVLTEPAVLSAAVPSEFSQLEPDEAAPTPAVSADGATRLLVTAYIGIGNRIFLRGDGPGLSWDQGVPLQFVSIGKWRWETAEAAGPVRFKLYKNDELECVALGEQSLEAGRQQEFTARF